MTETLAEQLADYRASWRARVPADKQTLMDQYVAHLAATGIDRAAKQVGDRAPVIPGIASGGRGAIRPRSQRPRQPKYAGVQIRRDQPNPCAVPVSFQCRAELGRAGEHAKEPLVRGRRFAALDANAHLIPRRGVSPSCQKVRTSSSLSRSVRGGTIAASDGLIWPRVGYASITFPQWRSVDFLPLRWHAFLAMPKKVSGPSSFAGAPAASGAG